MSHTASASRGDNQRVTLERLPTAGYKTNERGLIAATLQDSTGCTGVAANLAAAELIEAIVKEIKKEGGFTLPSFGAFSVAKKGA